MKTVIIAGDRKERQTSTTLLAYLQNTGLPYLYVGDGVRVPRRIDNVDLLVLEMPSSADAGQFLEPLVILKNGCDAGGIPNDATVILDTAFRRSLPSGIKVISCGLSSSDTITFSSLDAEKAMLSVQRSFERADGAMVCEMEMPVLSVNGVWGFPQLAAAAAALYLGCTGIALVQS